MHPNSIAAHKTIAENGLLSGLKFVVYNWFAAHGAATTKQMLADLSRTGNDGSFVGRVTDLCDLGVLHEVGRIIDPVTKHRVSLWDITDNLPVRPDPKLKKADRLKAQDKLIAELNAKVNAQADAITRLKEFGEQLSGLACWASERMDEAIGSEDGLDGSTADTMRHRLNSIIGAPQPIKEKVTQMELLHG